MKTPTEIVTRYLLVLSFFLLNPQLFAADKNGKPAEKITVSREATPIRANQILMQKKMQHAQGLLRGLALEDFISIEKDAKELSAIATASSWYNTDSIDYQRYFQNFQEAAKFTQDNALQKNLEGVAMGYVRITLTCMQCHNFVRAERK